MAHKSGKKAETHKRMLDAVGRNFRQFGFSGVGVDSLAKAAAVTSGAFYAHFGSKSAAFDAALIAGLDEVISGIKKFQADSGAQWLNAFVDYYLGKPHRSNRACSCAMATLTPEVVRSDSKVHGLYEKKMAVIVALVVQGLAAPEDDRHNRAWAMLSLLIGGLNVAQAMKNSKAADEVATAVKAAAIKVAGRTQRVK